MSQHNVLVFGASGFIGGHLLPVLQTKGWAVRAAGRNQDKLQQRWPDLDCVYADVLKPESLSSALADVDIVYYLVHAMTEGDGFAEREYQGAVNLAKAAEHAGVKRIIYLGALHPDGADSLHLRSRSATGKGLRQSTVPVTEIRAPIIIGPGSAAFEVMRDLVYHLPLMITPKWVRSKMPPIALTNLLHYLVEVIALPEQGDVCYDVAGPELLSYEQQIQQFAAIIGKKLTILPVPLLSPRFSARWLHLITSVPNGIARALIGGLKHDLTADDSAIRQRLPQPLLSFDQAVRQALAQEQAHVAKQQTPTLSPQFQQRWQPNFAFYPKTSQADIVIDAPQARVWQEICRIGGDPRYFALDILWRIREAIDALIGGQGLHYYRRDPNKLILGDKVDTWTVGELEPLKKLTLLFGMKAPGVGGMTFELAPHPAGCHLSLTCWWHPAGAAGLLYWWLMLPAHVILFRRMLANIGRLAERPSSGSRWVEAQS